jgi:hypothetical protein
LCTKGLRMVQTFPLQLCLSEQQLGSMISPPISTLSSVGWLILRTWNYHRFSLASISLEARCCLSKGQYTLVMCLIPPWSQLSHTLVCPLSFACSGSSNSGKDGQRNNLGPDQLQAQGIHHQDTILPLLRGMGTLQWSGIGKGPQDYDETQTCRELPWMLNGNLRPTRAGRL